MFIKRKSLGTKVGTLLVLRRAEGERACLVSTKLTPESFQSCRIVSTLPRFFEKARKAHKVGLGSVFKTIRIVRIATGPRLLYCCEGLLLAGRSSADGFQCRNQQFGFIGLDDVGLVL